MLGTQSESRAVDGSVNSDLRSDLTKRHRNNVLCPPGPSVITRLIIGTYALNQSQTFSQNGIVGNLAISDADSRGRWLCGPRRALTCISRPSPNSSDFILIFSGLGPQGMDHDIAQEDRHCQL